MNTPEPQGLKRREFLKLSATAAVAGSLALESEGKAAEPRSRERSRRGRRVYRGAELSRVAFPMGGLGAGMICLEGSGALSHFSLRHRPEVFHEPVTFAAICVKGKKNVARVLEGPVPDWKKFGQPGSGNGASGAAFGLPHFRRAQFGARFPFATVNLSDEEIPLTVELTGWSPFEPGDADNASLPAVALEYRFTNSSRQPLEAVFSWNARNFMTVGRNRGGVKAADGGFTFWSAAPAERGWEEGSFSATVSEPGVKVNHAWFRGGWFDGLTMAWRDVAEGKVVERAPITEGEASPGASLFVPFTLAPKSEKTIVLRLAWHVGKTNLRIGKDFATPADDTKETYQPWYLSRFKNVDAVTAYWREHYDALRAASKKFSDCLYASTIPEEALEAVTANLTILKSPTVLRQRDGRFWGWEGCGDNDGCCHGTCTHVWNYAQAIPHLFPSLERTLRETEFGPTQNEKGSQQFRAGLPIRAVEQTNLPACDGQLGGMMKVLREWRISGDTEWLRKLWPKVRQSMDFCIETWDPGHKGWVEEPHHNTYDIEFWGPDGMCASFYLGALKATVAMGKALGDEVKLYEELLLKGAALIETELFDGEYFIQKVEWKSLRAKNPAEETSGLPPEAAHLAKTEGPKYQYATGCLSDGVLGAWLAWACGVGPVLDQGKVGSHLRAVHKYNLKADLTAHANPQRPSYACGAEAGLLLCTWPKGGEPSLPFVYSNEVWTGIEYQVATHLIALGFREEGLEIVRAARERYTGEVRNPFNEYECGHWYARAMSSYALLQALSGARYDAVEKVLYLEPRVRGDFQCFLATASGYGLVGVRRGKPFVEVASGRIDTTAIRYQPAA
jgi:uncharacterized protein (DUF608 family)